MGNDTINTKKRKLTKKTKKINKIQNIHGKGCKEYQVYVVQGRVLKEDKIKKKKTREEDTRRACF